MTQDQIRDQMQAKHVETMTDEELATEASRLIARVLLILDQYGQRHPELPMWHLFARVLRDGLEGIESKVRLLKTPPASDKEQ